MKSHLFMFIIGTVLCCFVFVDVSFSQVLLAEDFESLELGPFLDEVLPSDLPPVDAKVWTSTPPAGWTVDNFEMPEGGVRDWRGWTFANVNAWAYVAGDQRRSEFTKAQGVAAIADSDEWDDMPHDPGTYNTYLNSPSIPLTGVTANSVQLTFDSSWRPESQQQAALMVSFNGGNFQEVFFWSSTEGDPFYHPDTSTNETITVDIENPANMTSMMLRWEYFNASNNWWWAIDNIEVTSGNSTLFSEDFEGLPLESFLDEELPQIQPFERTRVWTSTPPMGWTVDNFEMPAGGVRDWSGWTFANTAAWAYVAGDQRRSEFTKARGVAAIADPDEWDDLARDPGSFNSYLHSPSISIAGVSANSIEVVFDSSWRPESPQMAAMNVAFNGGNFQEVFFWSSEAGDPDFHPDTSTNETVTVDINNPAGANSMVLRWDLFNAGNNWWWAIDNIAVRVRGTGIQDWHLFQ